MKIFLYMQAKLLEQSKQVTTHMRKFSTSTTTSIWKLQSKPQMLFLAN